MCGVRQLGFTRLLLLHTPALMILLRCILLLLSSAADSVVKLALQTCSELLRREPHSFALLCRERPWRRRVRRDVCPLPERRISSRQGICTCPPGTAACRFGASDLRLIRDLAYRLRTCTGVEHLPLRSVLLNIL